MKKLPDNEVLKSFSEDEQDEILKIWKLAHKKRITNDLEASELRDEWQRLQLRLKNAKDTEILEDYGENNVTHVSSHFSGKPVNRNSAASPGSLGGSKNSHGLKPSLNAKRHSKIGHSYRIRRLYPFMAAVAAVLLAGFAGWYFFVPVTIEAPRGAFATYEWSDGTRVELNSGTQLTYNRSLRNGHRSVHLNGEAYFDVPASDRTFEVQTHNARVQVLGTRFNVRSWGHDTHTETILTLIEGEVTLSSFWQPEASVMLQPGQWSRVDHLAETPYEPEEVDTSRALAWRDKGFYFSSTPLSRVTTELERRFNFEITLQNEEIADRNLTLYLPTQQDLESIISSICHLTGCRYDWSDEQVILY